MGIFKRKEENSAQKSNNSDPVLAAVVLNTVSSEIYQDILKENGIKFICTQHGADGYLKHVFGRATIPDYIYVSAENYERACELYKVFIESDGQIQVLETEE